MGRDLQGSRAPAPHRSRDRRSRSVAALARRAAGAFLLGTFALLAFAPVAEAQVSAVQNHTATAVSQTQIDLSWDAPSQTGNGSIRYVIDIRQPPNANIGTRLRSFGDNHTTTTYSATGLQPGTLYGFRITACDSNATCTSTFDTENTQATARTLALPGAPTNLRYDTPTNDNQDPLRWNAPSNRGTPALTSYEVRRRQTTETVWEDPPTDIGSTATTYNINKASWGVGYFYQVRAVNSAGESGWSNEIRVGGRPTWKSGAAGTPTATPATDRVAVTLDWSTALSANGGKDISEWRYRYTVSGQGAWTTVSNIAPGTTSVTVTHTRLQPNTAYDFDVIACNDDRCSFTSPDATGAMTLDLATASVADAAADEGDAISFTVTLSHTRTSNVALNWATSNGTATAPADYTATASGTVTIPAGQTTATFTVQTAEDASDEPDETFTVTLSSPPAGVVLGDATATGTIRDDDPLPVLSVNSPRVQEGDSGTTPMTFTFTLSPASGRTVTVDTTVGTGSEQTNATPNVDYTRASASPLLTFAPGETSKTIVLPVRGDTDVEDDEAVQITMGPLTNAVFAGSLDPFTLPGNLQGARVQGTIVNDDEPRSEHAEISATDPSPLTEDNLNGATLTVDLLGALYDPWAPRLDRATVTASGVPGVKVADVTRVSDRRMAVTLAYDDTDFDDDKTLRVDFYLAHTSIGTISAVTPVKAVVEAPPAQVQNVRATAGTQRVRVQWDGVPTAYENLDLNVYRVQWKRSGSSGGWHERRVRGSRTSYTIGANPGTEVTVRVIATRHKAPDGPPSAEVRAPSTPAFSYRLKGTEPAQLTGVNLNGAAVTVELQGAKWNLALSRHRFRLLSGSVTGVRVERVERISASEARIVLSHRGPVITEDGELKFTIYADTYSWNEDLTVTVPVKAPGHASGVRIRETTDTTVTVEWDRFGGVNVYYQVRWKESEADGGWRGRWMRGWSRPGSMPWYQIRDLTPGTEYTVQVRYYDRGGVGFGRWTTATMTPGGGLDTAQNQTAGVTVAAADPVPVDEGGEASYTVVLDGRPAGNVTIAVSSDNADVTTEPASLTFTPDNWQTAQTVTVSAAHDGDAADEAATLSHAASGADGYAGIAVASVAVVVTDDDTAGVTVSETELSIEEGGSASYTVVLDTQPAGDVTIHPAAHGGGLTAAPSELTFTPQNWNQAQTVTVSAAHDDDKLDGQGYVSHGILVPPESAYASIAVAGVVVSVDDDDLEAQAATELSTDATLSGLAVSQGRLSAVFDAATTAYRAIVPEAASSITVTPTAADADATVTVNGVAVESGSPSGPVAVSQGAVVTVRVTAPDGVTTQDYVLTVDPQAPWILRLVREDRPFTTVAETNADAAYPSTFLRLERGSSTAPIPDWLPVTVGGTATNPADYEFNHGNQFRGITRKSDDLMRGARKFTIKGDGVDEGAETITLSVTIEGRTLTAILTIAEPRLAVADASVQEAAGAALAFRVTLAPATGGPVTVDWATADGSAVAGQDYTAASGTLTFLAGETEKTVSVAVLDDDIDEGSETMTLRLTNPSSGVALGDAEATGTIANTDLMPQAWLGRFGRTVADQVIDAVSRRFEVTPEPGSTVSIAGQAISADGSPEAQAACAAWRAAHRDRHGTGALADGKRAGFSSGTGGLEDRCRSETRTLTGRELLTGSSFAFTGGSAETGFGTVWGSGALTRFDGREGGLTLDGDVASALLGADFRLDRATVGIALAHSQGDGSYRGAGSGEVESALTGVYPYGRYAVSQRLSLWGIAGYGAGTLTLTPEGGSAVETDTDMAMGAAGARGVLIEASAGNGPELAVKADGLLLRMSSDAARDGAGGRLAAADADVTRLRLGLEGTWRGIETGNGGTLTPTLEVGVRHDDGDAETGLGVEAGAGLAWSDPASGIAAELKARGLLTHEADGFRERGLSGAFAWDPTPGSDRGPSLTLTQTLGASASDGVNALFREGSPARLAASDAGGVDARRFEAKFGYGTGAFGDRLTMTPELGIGLSDGSRDYGVGWRLNPSAGDRSSFELRLDATRREAAGGDAEPEHAVRLDLKARF